MDEPLIRPPKGVTFNVLSERVFRVLGEFTAFPWPLLNTQAGRLGFNPAQLRHSELERLIDPLARGVARFNTPEAGDALRVALGQML